MINYIKMKKTEWKLKAKIYGYLYNFINNKEDILILAKKIYGELKDVPPSELRDELMSKLAGVIYDRTHVDESDDEAPEFDD